MEKKADVVLKFDPVQQFLSNGMENQFFSFVSVQYFLPERGKKATLLFTAVFT